MQLSFTLLVLALVTFVSANTWVTYQYQYGQERCLVCAKIPLDGLPLGIEAPPFEYDLDHDQAEFEKYEGHCSVYRLVRDLHRIWLENGYGDMIKYFHSCEPQYYSVCTDPGVWDVLPASSDAVVHPNPLGHSTIARLQTWIERCDQEHEGCHGERFPVLPTRILDLGDPGSTSNVKLIETNGQRGQYIALSHCWGASNSFLTTRDTIQSRKSGFLPDKAPATFRDAIMLARCLRIRYLWVDSLCIIQGDTEDWNVESSRMGDVYRNVYLMVAAANAADDAEGFLKLRPKIQCSMKVVAPTGQIAKVYLRPQKHGFDDNDLPLDSRGWTLQETYLSRRQLKFMDNKILWNCQSTQWDESERDDFEKRYRRGTWRSVTELSPGKKTHYANSYQSWYNMIQDFATRKFSVQTDRLPSLSGLAAMVAAQKNERYCAGLWWEDIGYSICWTTDNDSSFRPDFYIAPSWSWESVMGSAIFPPTGHSRSFLAPQPLDSVAFHDYQAILRRSNQYGEIECAWLELEAPLAPLFKATNEGKGNYQGVNRREYFSIVNTISEELLEVEFDFREEPVNDLSALFMMHVTGRTESRRNIVKHRTHGVRLSGLILRPAHNQEKTSGQYKLPKGVGLYQRVGFFYLATSGAKEKVLEMAPITKVVFKKTRKKKN
ncbi:hypothetical protein G7Y89_g6562 [Cudoniella acicularis]|uniref:Heterokaryon incompatibility domain-containing protein n=1 Tax=Cudoniella acicularis TaxID=354080 RepID=A0A8H4RM04_9HELO|nr:hypothetical protein G7Y89_g6562 [Cudoniella acicularis]